MLTIGGSSRVGCEFLRERECLAQTPQGAAAIGKSTFVSRAAEHGRRRASFSVWAKPMKAAYSPTSATEMTTQ